MVLLTMAMSIYFGVNPSKFLPMTDSKIKIEECTLLGSSRTHVGATTNLIIKSSRNCARCDWPVRVHYSSIKHAPYVTRVLYGVIMHAAYVTSFSARNFFNIL